MSIKKTVKVTNRQQLIDLNGDTINFDLTFTATAKNGEEFEVVVVDQSTLDNNPNIEFKKATGTISGNIVSDKNIYQNYFLCLKASQPCEVDVNIIKREIPPQTQQPLEQYRHPPQMDHLMPPPTKESINWKMIIIIFLVIGGGILLFFMYSKKKDPESSVEGSKGELAQNIPSSNINGNVLSDSLLSRLNSISVK